VYLWYGLQETSAFLRRAKQEGATVASILTAVTATAVRERVGEERKNPPLFVEITTNLRGIVVERGHEGRCPARGAGSERGKRMKHHELLVTGERCLREAYRRIRCRASCKKALQI
jgi:hypothetical protein